MIIYGNRIFYQKSETKNNIYYVLGMTKCATYSNIICYQESDTKNNKVKFVIKYYIINYLDKFK